jgi:hypothetical protein
MSANYDDVISALIAVDMYFLDAPLGLAIPNFDPRSIGSLRVRTHKIVGLSSDL